MLPEGWEKSSIQKIATVFSGGTPDRKNYLYWNGSIPWVTTSEIKFHLISDTKEKITFEGLQNSSAKIFPKNTILIAMYGQGKTRGKVAKLGIDAATNQACAAIILKDKYNVDFYYQLLMSKYKFIRDLSNDGSQKNLNAQIIKSISVPIPPLPEQQKIAQILSTWDKAIDVTEQLIANSQKRKKALMQQLLTGKKRLLDENGEIFCGKWEKSAIKLIATITKGQQLNKDTLFDSGSFPVINGGISPSGYTDKYNHHGNTITISEGGNSCGYVDYQKDFFWCGGHCYTLSNITLNVLFTYQLFKFNEKKIMGLRVGSGLPNIQKKALENLPISYPSNTIEQQKIATVLSTADREIEALQKKLNYLKQEKKALMQQLLTGKKRVIID